MRPQYVNREDIPAEAVESERRIAEATAREEGKPEAALEKIVEGRINGFYKEVVLLEQSSVQDSKKTVRAVLTEANTTVSRFARFEVGA
jgi:elongation factor Ts